MPANGKFGFPPRTFVVPALMVGNHTTTIKVHGYLLMLVTFETQYML